MTEAWKTIDGYDGCYEISNMGRIRSTIFRNNKCTVPRIKYIRTVTNNRNRVYVSLYKNGHRKCCTVHRLVAKAFIPNPLNLPEVNHIDGNTTNNSVANLEWCTKTENCKHAYENDLSKLKSYNESKYKPIIRSDGMTFKNAYECAKEMNVSPCSIRDVLKNRIRTCKGFTFKYMKG